MEIKVNTKMKIVKPVTEVFEAIVDPAKMANYWFSSGTGRWEEDKTITLRYEEYDAQGDIKVLEVQVDKKIVFQWGETGEETIVTITLKAMDNTSTIIEVNEQGWNENDEELITKLLGNKGGWVYMLTCLKGYLENDINDLRASLVF